MMAKCKLINLWRWILAIVLSNWPFLSAHSRKLQNAQGQSKLKKMLFLHRPFALSVNCPNIALLTQFVNKNIPSRQVSMSITLGQGLTILSIIWQSAVGDSSWTCQAACPAGNPFRNLSLPILPPMDWRKPLVLVAMGLRPTKPTRPMKAPTKASTTILDLLTKTLWANSMFTREIKATQMVQWVTSATRNSVMLMVTTVGEPRATIATVSVQFRSFDHVWCSSPSPAIGVMGGAQVFMVGGQQEEMLNSQVANQIGGQSWKKLF